ncbi:MAG TPA: hypothetical protein VF438_04100 [Candidatus Paceibacterota bacterium]
MKNSLSTARIVTTAAIAAVVVSWTLPAAAAGTTTKAVGAAAAKAPSFCSTFDASYKKADAQLSAHMSALMSQMKARDAKLVTNRGGADAAIAEKRTTWTGERTSVYATLAAKATTDAQKQAVTAFKASMEAAIAAREASIDRTRSVFRTGVDQLLVKHTAAVNTALGTYQTALKNAASQAEAACNAKQKSTDVRNQYRAAVKAARADRQAAVRTINKVGTDVRKLAETRNASIQLALTTFQNSQTTALNLLKIAFGEKPVHVPTATSTSPTASSVLIPNATTTSR